MSETTQAAEGGVEADDTDATTIVVIGLVSTVLVLASALGVTALYDATVASLTEERVVAAVYNESETALAEQETQLSGSPRVLDPTKGVYSIPIDRAMSLVVLEMAAEQKAADPESSDE